MESFAEMAFEQLYRELEDTVRRLETGELTLADSLALFERGTRLAEQCNACLDQAELRVQQVTMRPDGVPEATPFDGWQGA